MRNFQCCINGSQADQIVETIFSRFYEEPKGESVSWKANEGGTLETVFGEMDTTIFLPTGL